MSGQGSPHRHDPSVSSRMLRRWTIVRTLVIAALILAAGIAPQLDSTDLLNAQEAKPPATTESDSQTAVRHRLRIAWGGGTARTWIGSMELVRGRIVEVVPLGMQTDCAASLLLDQHRLIIRQWLNSTYNGCDLVVEVQDDAEIHFELADKSTPDSPWFHQMSLREVFATGPLSRNVDDAGNRLLVYRAPGDAIDVELSREHLIFEPGESFDLTLRLRQTGMTAGSEGFLRIRHVDAEAREAMASPQQIPIRCGETGNVEPSPLRQAIDIADREGVFNIELELVETQKRGPFTSEVVRAARRIQYVVLSDSEAPRDESHVSWQEQFVLDPAKPDRWMLRRQATQIKLPVRYPPVLGDGASTLTLDSHVLTRLAPKGWQALAIPIEVPHRPHLLEIEYIGSQPMALGLSILEPDASGRIPVTGTDAGLFIPHSVAQSGAAPAGKPTLQRHRIVFWPGTKLPYLALANHDESRDAVYGKIRVLAGPLRLAAASPLAEKNLSTETRGRMLLLQRPNLSRLFGAPVVYDANQNLTLEDWTSVYQSVDRLTQFLRAHGYAGMIMTVAADGSAIYPSRLLSPSPRLENGAFFENGQDPLRKDVVELICRMFDRAGLKLVPAVEFSGMLPELEMVRTMWNDPLLDLQADRGEFWFNSPIESGSFRPPYNPLQPRVQTALLNVVDELADRYSQHDSFGGVALVVNDHTVLGIPGLQWGHDSLTRQRFQQTVDGMRTLNAVHSTNRASEDAQWTDWRCRQLGMLMEQMALNINQRKPSAQLYLLPFDDSIDSALHAGSLAESTSSNSRGERMRVWGFDLDRLAEEPDIVVLGTRSIGRWQKPPNDSHAPVDSLLQQPVDGIAFLHQSIWVEFEQLGAANPFGSNAGQILRLQHFVPGDFWNRRRYANGLASADAPVLVDGGWGIPQGQEASTGNMFEAFSDLPAAPFATVAPKTAEAASQSSPLVVRQYQSAEQSYFYAVNITPWPVEVDFQLGADPRNSLRTISAHGLQIDKTVDGQPQIHASLSGYDFVAFAVDGANVIEDYIATLPPDATSRLQQEILELKSKLANVQSRPENSTLENAGFESRFGANAPTAWEVSGNGQVLIDSSNYYEGSSSLFVRGVGDDVRVISQPIEAAKTGRISIAFWVRWNTPGELRVTISGEFGTESIVRTATVRAGIDANNGLWREQTVHFNDLPGELTQLRVGFAPADSTAVWIDRVEIHDRWLDDEESQALKQMLNLAGFKLHEQGDLVGCLSILESYWPRFVDQYYSPATAAAELNAPGRSTPATRR